MDTCREVSALVSKGMDVRLSLVERLRVQLHLAICVACQRFSRHVQILRRAARQLGKKGTGP